MSENGGIELQPFTIDQMAGSLALIIGSIGALLTIIWQSRCECEMNLCWCFRCHRKPPPDTDDKKKDKKKEKEKNEEENEEKEKEELKPNIILREDIDNLV